MRKPKTWHNALVFDPQLEQSITNIKYKATRIKNMLLTGKPVYCTLANARVQLTYCVGDLVYVNHGSIPYTVDRLSKLSYQR
jgi:hypothetical protein